MNVTLFLVIVYDQVIFRSISLLYFKMLYQDYVLMIIQMLDSLFKIGTSKMSIIYIIYFVNQCVLLFTRITTLLFQFMFWVNMRINSVYASDIRYIMHTIIISDGVSEWLFILIKAWTP
jgi:hypothetical protein